MAVLEGLAGIAFLILPAMTVSTLLDTPLDTPGGLAVGRLAGAALLSLAVACWNARNSERGGAARGVITAMLFYNVAASAILAYAGIRLNLQSALLWPAFLTHVVLAALCLFNLWRTQKKLSKSGVERED